MLFNKTSGAGKLVNQKKVITNKLVGAYRRLGLKRSLVFAFIFAAVGLITLFLVHAYSRTAADWNMYAPPLRECESSGQYAINTGNGYYGAYQFDISTWQGYDGYKVYHYPRADQAPPNIQDLSAYQLFLDRGLQPWGCASYALSNPYYGPADSTGAATPSSTSTPIGGNLSVNNDPKGVTDTLDCNRVVGWAFDPDNSGASIEVHIYIDGAGYNTGPTAASRPDVNNVYGITGTHGFDWPVPGQYRDGRTHTVDVYAINTPSGGGNPKLRTGSIGPCGSVNRSPLAITDSINCQSIAGWAFDPDRSDASIRVDVYMDGPAGQGAGVASFTANGARPDVNNVYGITGNHGFSWPLASQYRDGRTHTAYLYAIGLDQNGATNGDNPQITAQPNNGVFGPCAAPTTTTVPTSTTTIPTSTTTTTPTTTTTTTTITSTGTKTIVGVGSGRCLDVVGVSKSPGAPVQLFRCIPGQINQQWTFVGNTIVVYKGLKNPNGTSMEMCLDVNGGSTADGASVIVWPCHGGTNQQWVRKADGTIQSVSSSKYLDAYAGGTGDGTRIIIWPLNGGNNQKWQ